MSSLRYTDDPTDEGWARAALFGIAQGLAPSADVRAALVKSYNEIREAEPENFYAHVLHLTGFIEDGLRHGNWPTS